MIRLAVSADVAALQRVETSAATAFVGTHMAFAIDDAPTAATELLAAIGRQLLRVATVDDAVVGFLFAEPCADGLYVRELSVAADFQQQGHGAALIAVVSPRHELAASGSCC